MVSRPIIIPSKNIYAKDNQKVIKNLIDYIEADQKIPQIIADTQNVYNENITNINDFYDGTPQDKGQLVGPDGGFLNIAYVKLNPTYTTKTITIPKQTQNSSITKLLTGLSDTGYPNITYTLRGIVKNGTQTGSVTFWNWVDNTANFISATLNQPTNITGEEKYYTLDDKKSVSITVNEDPNDKTGHPPIFNADASVTLDDLTNVVKAKATEYTDHYTITLTILCGLEIIKCGGYYTGASPSGNNSGVASISGTYEKYDPLRVRISFKGNVLELDLQDNTLTIGNGKNTYSFSGNELMQDTNSPTVRDTYNKVLTQYINGKEVATLKCNIDDYYDTNGNLVVSPKTQWRYDNPVNIKKVKKLGAFEEYGVVNQYYQIEVIGTKVLREGNHLYYNSTNFADSGEIATEQLAPIYGLAVPQNGDFDKKLDSIDTNTELTLGLNSVPIPVNMTFHIGDTVIPYVYSAQGVDRPMSYYIDNTPKQFVVVGKGISYRGRVYQTLTLQEVTKNIDTNS